MQRFAAGLLLPSILLPVVVAAAWTASGASLPGVSMSRASSNSFPTATHSHEPRLKYQGGLIMSNVKTYAIFWLPDHAHFEPHGSDARFEHLIQRYLRDVGGTRFYNILTEYSYFQPGRLISYGPIKNSSRFGGAAIDRAPYPKTASNLYGFSDTNFVQEIANVADRKGWSIDDTNNLFILFLGAGAHICESQGIVCNPHDFCAWHNGYENGPIFAVIDDVQSEPGCTLPASPNGDLTADSEIDLVSHEHFESVTDPTPCTGWAASCDNQGGDEIADLCQDTFGTANLRRGNVLLHGHHYLVQAEWSNRDGECVLGSNAPAPTGKPEDSLTRTGLRTIGLVLLWLLGASLLIFVLAELRSRRGRRAL